MDRPARLPTVLGVLHQAIALGHALTHHQLGIYGSAAQLTYVVLVIHLAPVLALWLLRRDARAGTGLLTAALAGACVYGIYFHFIADSNDHVHHLPSSAWALPFQVTAVLLALCDAIGATLLARALLLDTALLLDARHIILVDGECVFCNRLVSSILRLDHRGLFQFAHLQGSFARALVQKHGGDPDDVDPVYLLANVGTEHEVLLLDGAAGREIWPRLIGAAILMRLVPLELLDLQYALFARVRYRLVGRYDTCYVPTLAERARYLE